MHHPTDRIAHTTAFVTPVVEHWLEREILCSFESDIGICMATLVVRHLHIPQNEEVYCFYHQ